MAPTTNNTLEAALKAIETPRAPKAQAERLTYAEARAYLAGGTVSQGSYTDINGVVRQQAAPIRTFGGEASALQMAAE